MKRATFFGMAHEMKLHPFCSVTECGACGKPIRNPSVKYSHFPVIEGAGGEFIGNYCVGDKLVPHLEKHCECGWGWLEECKPEGKLPPHVSHLV